MTKDEFIKTTQGYYQEMFGNSIDKDIISDLLDAMSEALLDGLLTDGKVLIRGLFKAELKKGNNRNFYNPMTKKHEVYKVKNRVVCSLGKDLINAINE